MVLKYRPKGTCSQMMEVEVENGIVQSVKITGGCNGNLQGIGALCEGQNVEDIIADYEEALSNI